MDKIYSYFNFKNEDTINQKLLNINSILNNINNDLELENNKLEIPTLVVVGSQSSGKSTVLNRIIGLNIIPIGSKMETRTPINIELINSKNTIVEFGDYSNGTWNLKTSLNISSNESDLYEVKNEIKNQTNLKAGEDMNISYNEINIRIYSPNVPNLNFIDLPGLTMIACTDKGQPKDIKTQIENLIVKYIKPKNNIIMCIMPAREDLETDIALDLVKKYDNNCDRTVGILTKIDLMNKNNDISNYLLNNISKDLQMKYGYYAIKNSTNSLDKDSKNEMEYFNNHIIYAKHKNINKFGIVNLSNNLSNILLKKIKKSIPDTILKINDLIVKNTNILKKLGEGVPDNIEMKNILINKYITNISSNFINNLENRCSKINTGRLLKEIFINYRNEILKLNPFSNELCNNKILEEIIKNSDGNHMNIFIPTIEILESALVNNNIKSFDYLIPISLKCSSDITLELKTLVNKILVDLGIDNFKEFYKTIESDIYNDLIIKYKEITDKKILEYINIEKNYIWTDDLEFTNSLSEILKSNINEDILRKILVQYFKSVQKTISHNIPKIIMTCLVREIQKNINIYLLDIQTKNKYLDILHEDKDIFEKRKKYTEILDNLHKSKSILNQLN